MFKDVLHTGNISKLTATTFTVVIAFTLVIFDQLVAKETLPFDWVNLVGKLVRRNEIHFFLEITMHSFPLKVLSRLVSLFFARQTERSG